MGWRKRRSKRRIEEAPHNVGPAPHFCDAIEPATGQQCGIIACFGLGCNTPWEKWFCPWHYRVQPEGIARGIEFVKDVSDWDEELTHDDPA